MTDFQKFFCIFLSLCFLGILASEQRDFRLQGDVLGQLPLYRYLEKSAEDSRESGDRETEELLVEANGSYLVREIQMSGETEDELSFGSESADREEVGTAGEAGVPEEENLPGDIEEAGDPEAATAEDASPATAGDAGEILEEASVLPSPVIDLSPEALSSFEYVMNQFYILDSGTATSESQINALQFLEEDLTMEQDSSVPQILIYHSHSQEAFADSREGEEEDTIVGVGSHLAGILTEVYGYQVIHVTESFDLVDGELDRSLAYDYAREYVEQVLEENPTIQVIIDLHRDGVSDGRRLVTEIDGKETAQLLFFNGLSYTADQGTLDYLPNPYIEENLAFSFQLEYQAALYYPDLYRGIYLSGLRYNLHLRPKALLLEAGAQTNTVQEVKNAMEPFADILHRVLSGDS